MDNCQSHYERVLPIRFKGVEVASKGHRFWLDGDQTLQTGNQAALHQYQAGPARK